MRSYPAVIAGLLWSLRPEHGPVGVEDDLTQLATAGLICRYTGADGKQYLHIVTFQKHQRISRPSAQAQLLDDGDRLLAHATSTCMVFPCT